MGVALVSLLLSWSSLLGLADDLVVLDRVFLDGAAFTTGDFLADAVTAFCNVDGAILTGVFFL